MNVLKKLTKNNNVKNVNLSLIYKDKKIDKTFKNIPGSTLKDFIVSISPYLNSEQNSEAEINLSLDNDAYLSYEIASEGKYLLMDQCVRPYNDLKVYDGVLTEESFLDRINPDKSLRETLHNHLFFNKNNFFDFFTSRQQKIIKERNANPISFDQIQESVSKYSSFETSPSISTFSSIMSFLIDFKYSSKYDHVIEAKNTEQNFPSICWTQNLSMHQQRHILGHVDTVNSFDIEEFTKSDLYEKFGEVFTLSSILNSDDKRYVKLDNSKTYDNLQLNQSVFISDVTEYINSNRKGNIQVKGVDYKNSIKQKVDKHIKEILADQDKIYNEFFEKEEAKRLMNDETEDKLIKKIKFSKLFRLETELANRLFKELLSFSHLKFNLHFEKTFKKETFQLFHLLRRFSQTRENLSNRHQFGFFFSNGFATVNMFSRPFYGEVESSINHLASSRIFNLSINETGEFIFKEEIQEFIKLIEAYIFSYTDEVEALKDIYDMSNKH